MFVSYSLIVNPLLVPHELFVCCFDGKNAVVKFHGILFNHATKSMRGWTIHNLNTSMSQFCVLHTVLSCFYNFKPHVTKGIIYLFNWLMAILWLNVFAFKGCYKIHCLEMIRNALKLERKTLRATVCLRIRNVVKMDI